MSDKISLIGDKDLGHVLGAVRQLGAEDALALDKLVDDTGLPLRADGPETVLSFPRDHLKTWAATNEAVLTSPRAFAVVDGVPQPLAFTLAPVEVKLHATGIKINLKAKAKVKASLRKHSDGTTVVVDAQLLEASPSPSTLLVRLDPGTYDVLLLAEGHVPFLAADQKL